MFVTKMNASAANLDAANPPAIAVPEALPLPVAAGCRRDIGRAAIVTVAGSIIAGSVSIIARAGSNRTADDGSADQPASDGGGRRRPGAS